MEYFNVSEQSVMEFRDFEHRKWKKRLRGKLKTTNTDLIKLKRRSRRRHEISRINRINYTPYKSSRYLRDLRFLPLSRRGFSHFWVVMQCIGIVYACFMTCFHLHGSSSPRKKKSRKQLEVGTAIGR